MPELVDTHCHLDFEKFDDDREAVIDRAHQAGVTRIVVPGLDLATSQAAIALSESYDGVYAAVGMHPNSLENPPELKSTISRIRELTQHPKVVAIGEIGLDYYWKTAADSVQKSWLEAQLELASDVSLPVILHNRESTEDILGVLQHWTESGLPDRISGRPGVMHSFSGTWGDAQITFAMNFWVGFTGPLTFKKSDELRQIAANAPADRILLETDAPFLAPHPLRGKRNEPSYMVYTAQTLADIRGETLESIARLTTKNAETLFEFALAG